MKNVTTTHSCDRCGSPFERSNCLIIEGLSFTASGYDDRGSGGTSVKDQELCSKCSHEFFDWFNRKSA